MPGKTGGRMIAEKHFPGLPERPRQLPKSLQGRRMIVQPPWVKYQAVHGEITPVLAGMNFPLPPGHPQASQFPMPDIFSQLQEGRGEPRRVFLLI